MILLIDMFYDALKYLFLENKAKYSYNSGNSSCFFFNNNFIIGKVLINPIILIFYKFYYYSIYIFTC